ncbi:MAG: multidrug effflux MFS transporter [Alcaligenaceae bacterium]|nr:multidrug effflux MFS transporter [Alcaligenaceae bacterium]
MSTEKTKFNIPLWLFIMAALAIVGPATIDLYLPTFPVIATDFKIPQNRVELTVSAFLFGLSISQIIVGPLTDRYGRKMPLLIGALLYLIASLICAFAPSFEFLLLGRMLQALGAACFMTISRAVIRDHYSTQEAANAMTVLMLLTGLAPVVAPMIGAFLANHTGWRGLFLILTGYGLVSFLLVAFFFKESLTEEKRLKISPKIIARNYFDLLFDRSFIGFSLAAGFSMATMFAFIASSSTILMEVYGLGAREFAWSFALVALGMLVGSQSCGFLLRRNVPVATLYRFAAYWTVLVLALGVVLSLVNLVNLAVFMLIMFCFTIGLGIINPTAPILALRKQGHRLGMASALTGATLFLFGTVSSAIVSHWHTGTELPLLATMLFFSLLALIFGQVLAKSK